MRVEHWALIVALAALIAGGCARGQAKTAAAGDAASARRRCAPNTAAAARTEARARAAAGERRTCSRRAGGTGGAGTVARAAPRVSRRRCGR
jgi:osmotically-inducible protein OsmY